MRKSLVAVTLSIVALMAVPVSASQFVRWSMDQMVLASSSVVHGQITATWSSWDAAHETISTYAELRVLRYIAGEGPATLIVREVGGTVGDYTQEAIGFPVLRQGEEVVLFLTAWQDTGHPRIQGYDQGKYLIKHEADGRLTVALDPMTQGADHLLSPDGSVAPKPESMPIEELDSMVQAVVKSRATSQVTR